MRAADEIIGWVEAPEIAKALDKDNLNIIAPLYGIEVHERLDLVYTAIGTRLLDCLVDPLMPTEQRTIAQDWLVKLANYSLTGELATTPEEAPEITVTVEDFKSAVKDESFYSFAVRLWNKLKKEYENYQARTSSLQAGITDPELRHANSVFTLRHSRLDGLFLNPDEMSLKKLQELAESGQLTLLEGLSDISYQLASSVIINKTLNTGLGEPT